jgi:hypothetical protein
MQAKHNFAPAVGNVSLTECDYRNIVRFHRLLGRRKPNRQRAAEIVAAHASIFKPTRRAIACAVSKGGSK